MREGARGAAGAAGAGVCEGGIHGAHLFGTALRRRPHRPPRPRPPQGAAATAPASACRLVFALITPGARTPPRACHAAAAAALHASTESPLLSPSHPSYIRAPLRRGALTEDRMARAGGAGGRVGRVPGAGEGGRACARDARRRCIAAGAQDRGSGRRRIEGPSHHRSPPAAILRRVLTTAGASSRCSSPPAL